MYFFQHKFAVEIDEKGHTDRDPDKENERQRKIEKLSWLKIFFTWLILMKRVLIFFLKLWKYKVTSLNQKKKIKRTRKPNKRTKEQVC